MNLLIANSINSQNLFTRPNFFSFLSLLLVDKQYVLLQFFFIYSFDICDIPQTIPPWVLVNFDFDLFKYLWYPKQRKKLEAVLHVLVVRMKNLSLLFSSQLFIDVYTLITSFINYQMSSVLFINFYGFNTKRFSPTFPRQEAVLLDAHQKCAISLYHME